jgi:hypothetical protein
MDYRPIISQLCDPSGNQDKNGVKTSHGSFSPTIIIRIGSNFYQLH